MEILKISIDWARAELLSNSLFALFGAMFLVASLLFWWRGEIEVAKVFVGPMMIAGVLMLILSGGLLYGTWKSLTGFSTAFADDNARFIGLEVQRIDRTMSQYGTAVFNVIPLLIAATAILIVFVNSPGWRAALITVIIFLGLIMLIDSNANARLERYKADLVSATSSR